MRVEFYMNNFEYLGSSIVNENEKHQYYKINNECNPEILHTVIKEDKVVLNFFRRENDELFLEFSLTVQKDSASKIAQNILYQINNTAEVFYKNSNVDIILKEIKRKSKIEKILLLDYYNYSTYLHDEILLIIKNSSDIERIKYLCYLIECIKENNQKFKSVNFTIDFGEKYKSVMCDEIFNGLKDCYKNDLDIIAHIKTYNTILRKRKIDKLLK